MPLKANRRKRQKHRAVKYTTALVVIGTIVFSIYSFEWSVSKPTAPLDIRRLAPVEQLQLIDELPGQSHLILEDSLRGPAAPVPYSHLRHLIQSQLESANFPFHRVRIGLAGDAIELQGEVGTLEARDQLEVFVRRIRGVDTVYNKLNVIGYPAQLVRRDGSSLKN
jgi:hypothetical protein